MALLSTRSQRAKKHGQADQEGLVQHTPRGKHCQGNTGSTDANLVRRGYL